MILLTCFSLLRLRLIYSIWTSSALAWSTLKFLIRFRSKLNVSSVLRTWNFRFRHLSLTQLLFSVFGSFLNAYSFSVLLFLVLLFSLLLEEIKGKPPFHFSLQWLHLRKTLLLRSEIYQPSNSFLLASIRHLLRSSLISCLHQIRLYIFRSTSFGSWQVHCLHSINSKEFSKSNPTFITSKKENQIYSSLRSLFVLSFPSSSTLESISLDLHLSYFNSLSLRLFFRICLLSVLVVACLVSFIYLF